MLRSEMQKVTLLPCRATSLPSPSADGHAQLQNGRTQPAGAAAAEQKPDQPKRQPGERHSQPPAADEDRTHQQQQQQQPPQQAHAHAHAHQQQQQPRLSDGATQQQERPRQAAQPRTLPSGAREDDKQVRDSAQHVPAANKHVASSTQTRECCLQVIVKGVIYTKLELIGRGGSSKVYKVQWG